MKGMSEPLYTDEEAIAIGRQRRGNRLSKREATLLRKIRKESKWHNP